MRIQVIYTGGTIGMEPSAQGLVPGENSAAFAAWFGELCAEFSTGTDIRFSRLPTLIDSSNATPLDWQRILDAISAAPADAYVVLHGTDTMSYTAAALSYARAGNDTPVILTGAQLPYNAPGSDAGKNVFGALKAANTSRTRGVCLYFGNCLLAGNRSTKISSMGFDGFDTPLVYPLATAGVPWRWAESTAKPLSASSPVPLPWGKPAPYQCHDVIILDLAPGMSVQRLQKMLTPPPEALIIRAFGVGNCPSAEPGFVQVLADLCAADIPVVVSSQCQSADVTLKAYETGQVLANAGCVGSADMTLEATYAKLVFLLSQGLSGREIRSWMTRSVCGELS